MKQYKIYVNTIQIIMKNKNNNKIFNQMNQMINKNKK